MRAADHDGTDAASLIRSIPHPVSVWRSVRDDAGTLVDFVCTDSNGLAEPYMQERLAGRVLVGSRYLDVFDDEIGRWAFARFCEVVETGAVDTFESEAPRFPGVRFENQAARSGDGFVNMMRDITARSVAQRALQDSEQRFRGTMEALIDGVIILEPVRRPTAASSELAAGAPIVDLRFGYCNEAATRMLGRSLDQLLGHSYLEVFTERHTGAFDRYLDVARTGTPAHFEIPWLDAVGIRGAFEVSATPLGTGVVVVAHDVTGRALAQHEARESERQFRLMADHAGDIVIAARHGVIEWAAPSVERLMGWTVDDVVGHTATDFVHPDDAERLGAARWSATSTTRYRCRLVRKDGGLRWADLVGRIAGPDDEPEHPLVITIIDAQAEVEARDALQRAEEERQRLDEQVRESLRLESLSQLAGGIAHDFNNLLVGVLGNAELALQDLPPDSPVRSRLVALSTAAQRAAELTRQLLDFTGRQPREREALDLLPLIADTVDLAQSMIGRDITIAVEFGSASPGAASLGVVGDRSQLQQVVMNLLMNASEAVDAHTGSIRVSTRMRLVGDEAADLGLVPGPHVVLSVSDDGPGIGADVQRRIFDPFFTTRVGGRGLGLAVVSGIVRSHHGAVQVRSEEGRGSTFEVWLPATDAPLPRPGGPPNFRLRRAPTVMVVDDDDQVRDVVGDILRRAGFHVMAVGRGRDAITQFASRHAIIDAVVLDLTMPDMSGDEVMVVLRAVEPAIPIVVISGYLSNDPVRQAAASKATDYVQKPFLPDDLVDAVRRSLHQTPIGAQESSLEQVATGATEYGATEHGAGN